MARFRAVGAGEWPVGIHWSPGEERLVPAGYPGADGAPPAWLVPVNPAGLVSDPAPDPAVDAPDPPPRKRR